jgi:hypothetical protein
VSTHPAETSLAAPISNGTIARFMIACAVGFVAGALTLWSVPHLPFALEPLGNSAGPWVLVAFAVALSARRTGEAMVLAVVALAALVFGFYVAEAYRGWPVSRHQVVFWLMASVVIGPLVGAAAGWLRHGALAQAGLGAGVLGGLLAGEAVYGLSVLKFSTPSDYWHVQFFVGVALAVVLAARRGIGALALSATACVTVGLCTLVIYQLP